MVKLTEIVQLVVSLGIVIHSVSSQCTRTCDNGGTCVEGDTGDICQCVNGYTGPSCETDLDDCAQEPCYNGVTEYGNYIIRRFMPGGAASQRSFVDTEIAVPGPGRLVSWDLYVTYNPEYPQVPVRMQIWRKAEERQERPEFKLLHEERFILTSQHNGAVQLKASEPYQFDSDVLIGWTVEGAWSPINFEFSEGYKLHFLNTGGTFPVEGEAYLFGTLPYPAMFSVGVTVAPPRVLGSSLGRVRTAQLCSTSQKPLILSCFSTPGITNPIYVHSATLGSVKTDSTNCEAEQVTPPTFQCRQNSHETFESCHGKLGCTIEGSALMTVNSECSSSADRTNLLYVEYSCMREMKISGHETISRNNAGFESRARSWVDDQVTIKGPGRLLGWNLFVVHNPSYPRVPVRLQLWEPVTNKEATFRLLYETEYVFTLADNGTITILPDEQFVFENDVRFGFTTDDFGWIPISSEFRLSYKTYFLNLRSSPSGQRELSFGKLPYPAVFSVNVLTDGVTGGVAVHLPVTMVTSRKTLNVLSPSYPSNIPEAQPSLKCTIAPTKSTSNFTVGVEIVLLNLEPTSTNCEESLSFLGGKNVKLLCSKVDRYKLWKDSFNMSVQETLQIVYRKVNQTIGGRFWITLEGFSGDSRIDLNFKTEDVTENLASNNTVVIPKNVNRTESNHKITPTPNGNANASTRLGGQKMNIGMVVLSSFCSIFLILRL